MSDSTEVGTIVGKIKMSRRLAMDDRNKTLESTLKRVSQGIRETYPNFFQLFKQASMFDEWTHKFVCSVVWFQ
jgi:hypothetical protein